MFNPLFTSAARQVIPKRLLSYKPTKVYNFEEIKRLVEHPKSSKLLIDVREPGELKTYKMPTAINIPFNTSPGALGLSSGDFEDKFNFPKPSKSKELIFFCAKGLRAQSAEAMATSYGYTKTAIYPGSTDEWLAKGGNNIKPK
ncbi:hypothetical protein KAFR_0A04250 [Kazachstania africana CBS 2517]|uniref:Rhodanese domain-containing protein n=1 Tax=Kazachstania africana (strain ATCC 22294 / BCRC 22015 / CBS 2517 / CECT 1963 / NBRC 1671 / NRRL Y-8276) TaxID=1071382 RepID=H2ANB0_KAZAF|nr:hypothetical protein KAFR_0A04250 [Kazachstania africana CBS 2517]CCF55860.1 hypothetical protein KAFR_0A04250 [Kazachstania africana CBS 2517]